MPATLAAAEKDKVVRSTHIALGLEQPCLADPLSLSRNEKRDTSSFSSRQRDADELRGR